MINRKNYKTLLRIIKLVSTRERCKLKITWRIIFPFLEINLKDMFKISNRAKECFA